MNNKIKKVLLFILILIAVAAMNLLFWSVGKGELAGVIWYIIIPLCGTLFAYLDLHVSYDRVKLDFNKDKDYYRELIKTYSPSVLMLVYNPFSKYPLPLITGLFQLEKKGKIKIGQKISINEEVAFLTESEAFLLERIQDGVMDEDANQKYMELVFKEGIRNGLIYKKNPLQIKHGTIKSLAVFAVVFGLILLLGHFVPKQEIIIPLFFLSLTIYGVYNVYYQIFNKASSKFVYFNTDKGVEIANRLHGLKNFLKDFSKLDDSKKEDIIIWDDYLIYSVMFGINKKVKSQLSKFFEPAVKKYFKKEEE